MFTALFINAIAVSAGYFIGWMRAKEEYKGSEFMIMTEELLKDLKKEYKKHEYDQNATFIWNGEEMLVSYAKYLIEYLEKEFRNIKKK